jgi:hypothetical protein
MNSICLTGLVGSEPLGALAAFGLLRSCSGHPTLPRLRLSWTLATDWTAVLTSEGPLSSEHLLDILVERQHGRAMAPFLIWNDDLKVAPADFAAHLRKTRDNTTSHNREDADFFASFASEIVTARSTGETKPTAFHMTAGQQQFIKSVRALASSLDSNRPRGGRETPEAVTTEIRQAFAEALFGPWRYADDHHSLGWDPSREALHALSAIAPTKAGPSSVRAAVWLAFEALPLFPCISRSKTLLTRGFDATNSALYWPIWDKPISLDTLRSLLGMSAILEPSINYDDLRSRAIRAVFRSERSTDSNGRGTLRPAVLCVG